MILALLLAAAPALPVAPAPGPDAPADCHEVAGLPSGHSRPCDSESVPPALVTYWRTVEVDDGACRDTYALQVPALEERAMLAEADAARLRAVMAQPTPFVRRPGTVATVSVLGTLAVVVLGAEVVRAAGGR